MGAIRNTYKSQGKPEGNRQLSYGKIRLKFI
jgi:hypothetical protein